MREFQAWCRQRTYQGKRWVPFAKGGEYSPYYADIHLVVNWEKDGAEMKAFSGSVIRNPDYYFRPGLTWPMVTVKGLNVRILPRSCIFGHKGPAAFAPAVFDILSFVGLFNSKCYQILLGLQQGSRAWEVGTIQKTAIPKSAAADKAKLAELTFFAWSCKHFFGRIDDTSHAFNLPELLQTQGQTLLERAIASGKTVAEIEAELRQIQSQIDDIAFDLYGFTAEERQAVSNMIGTGGGREAEQPDRHEEEDADAGQSGPEENGCPSGFCSPAHGPLLTAHFFSWCLGVAFGRFDIRLALDPSLAPPLPDPFDPLPVCSPGMLIGPDGLPARPGHIVSEAWLRKRAEGALEYVDGFWRLPEGDNSLPTAHCPLPTDSEYPVRITWSGILPDDPGQPDDIINRVREVLEVLYPGAKPETGDAPLPTAHRPLPTAHSIEQEACDILGVKDLRDYFRRPAGFFADHLQRYSKSRRKAPIYWPLSTASGSYTLWLYYHRLTDQTLYACVQDYVNPKLAEVDQEIDQLQKDLAQGGTTAQRQRLETLQNFAQELRDFREELLRVAALPYKPDLNDGVLITAAPLWKLFRLPKWRRDLEDCWKKLTAGDYDWAHLAYAI